MGPSSELCEPKFSSKPTLIRILHGPRPNLSPADYLTGMARPEFTTKSALVGRAVHIGARKWPIFQVRNRKKFSTLFFSEIFSANKLFLWLQKIVLDLIYQIRQEYRDLRRSDPLFFELEGGTPKMTKNRPKRPKMAFLARLTGPGNKK